MHTGWGEEQDTKKPNTERATSPRAQLLVVEIVQELEELCFDNIFHVGSLGLVIWLNKSP